MGYLIFHPTHPANHAEIRWKSRNDTEILEETRKHHRIDILVPGIFFWGVLFVATSYQP